MKIQLNIYPSFYCNLECSCCMHNCSPNNKDIIDIKIVEYFLDFLNWCLKNNYDVKSICISGGEPFLYPNIYKLITYINNVMKSNKTDNYKIYFSMVTNGTVKLNEEYVNSFIDLQYPLTSIRISTSCFLDEQLENLNIKQNFTQYNKLAQECSFRRIVTINDKGRAKQLVKSDSEKYCEPILHCYNNNDILNISFMPKFISFCSEDSSGKDSNKTLQYDNLIKEPIIEESFKSIIMKASKYNTIKMLGGCKNKCKHYLIKGGR